MLAGTTLSASDEGDDARVTCLSCRDIQGMMKRRSGRTGHARLQAIFEIVRKNERPPPGTKF